MAQGAITAADLAGFVADLLAAAGTPAREAALTAAALVDADLEGLPSHGVMLLPMYLERIAAGSVRPAQTGQIVSDTGSQIVLDAGNGLGHVVAEQAASLAVERASRHGLAAVAVRNAFHFGAAGRFARQMALNGCVGIVMSNTRPLLPAPGGAERVVGNNPLAIAVPAGDEPIVLDLALSAGAMGKIRMAQAQGLAIPEGWAADAQGVPTTDPAAAITGLLLPAAGAKGFGLAVMIDLLCGGLSGGAIGNEVRPLYGAAAEPYGCAQFFLAVRVEGFRPQDAFEAAADRFAGTVRASRTAPGAPPARMPGDRAIAAHRHGDGTLSLAEATRAALRTAAETLAVPVPPFLNA